MRSPLLLVALTAALAAAWPAAPAGAATAICHEQATAPLDVSGAAAEPALVGGTVTTFGAARARTLASSFRSGAGDVCTLPATAAVRAQLAVIQRLASSGQTAAARRLLRRLLGQIAARPSRGPAAARRPAATEGTPCPADKKVKVKLGDADKVGDYLKAAAAAQSAGDQVGAQAATAAAQAAYDAWATGPAAGASTVGDYVALASGALKLGGDTGAAQALLDRARATAAADLAKASQFDRCTASRKDADCLTSAEAMAELVGASGSLDLHAAQAVMQAIRDRLTRGTLPDGCEEWSFSMKVVDTDANWALTWGPGRFRVNRSAGTLDGSQAAGYGAGWPGVVGGNTSDCVETTDDGTTDFGPVTIPETPFHYAIDGSVSGSAFQLSLSSSDVAVTVDAPDDPACQFLADTAQEFVDTFVQGPFPLEFDPAPGQTTATISDDEGSTQIDATIARLGPAAH